MPRTNLSKNWHMGLLIGFFGVLYLGTPYVSKYYLDHGLTVTQVLVLQAIWTSIVVVGTVPSGWLADRWGRRRVLIAGCIVQFVSSLYFPLCRGFGDFAISLVGTGVAASLLGGTSAALLMSSLREAVDERRQKQLFKSWRSKLSRRNAIGSFIACVVSGPLVKYFGPNSPFLLQPIIYLCVAICAFKMVEPCATGRRPVAMWETAWRMLVKHPQVRWAIAVDAVLITVLFVDFWLLQPAMIQINLAAAWFGTVYALRAVLMYISAYASVIFAKMRFETVWASLLGVACVGSFVAGLAPGLTGLASQVIVVSVMSTTGITMDSYLHKALHDDENRTTELSIVHAAEVVLFAAASPCLGYLAAERSPHAALTIMGAGSLVLGVFTLYMFRRTAP